MFGWVQVSTLWLLNFEVKFSDKVLSQSFC
jgi:hypothetical protein